MWLIALVAVLGGLIVGGLVVWLLMGSRAVSPVTLAPATTSPEPSAATSAQPAAPPSTSTQGTAQPPQPQSTPPEADTTAPDTPEIKFPPNNYWLSESDPKVEIRWSAVKDPSGVSYVLEFSGWLGGGAGWTEAKRTVPVKRLYYQHALAGSKERYRVIAIDGAGNESAPSAWAFLIQAPSASDAASLNASYHP